MGKIIVFLQTVSELKLLLNQKISALTLSVEKIIEKIPKGASLRPCFKFFPIMGTIDLADLVNLFLLDNQEFRFTKF